MVCAFSICLATSSTNLPPRWPAQGNFSIFLGMIVFTTNFFFKSPLIRTLFSWEPTSVERAVSKFPNVAERPQVLRSGFHFRSLARQSSVCVPRLLESNSCHSSTITARRSENASFVSGYDNSRERLSGVVTRQDGYFFLCLALTEPEVSPVLD